MMPSLVKGAGADLGGGGGVSGVSGVQSNPLN